MFFKIQKNSDLSQISYRCRKDDIDFIYIEYLEGDISDTWEQITKEKIELIAPEWFENVIELTQLDRIENAVSVSNEELRQEGADALTEALIDSGIL